MIAWEAATMKKTYESEKRVSVWRWSLLLTMLCTGWAAAQSADVMEDIKNSTAQERAEAQAEVLSDVLKLDPKQKQQLIEVNLKYSEQVQQLIDKGAEDTVVFVAIQQYARVKDDEIKALLTEDQIKRYEDHKARLRRIIEDVIQYRNR